MEIYLLINIYYSLNRNILYIIVVSKLIYLGIIHLVRMKNFLKKLTFLTP